MGVLIRNVSLKEKDTNRIRCLFRQLPADFGDERTQRLVTGSWFEEAKAMRYCDGLNGAELVLASLQRTSRAYTHEMGSPVMKALARATTAKVKDSASERTYNSPVIPNEDLEQNDTEEENSTPSTASASEVPVRVDWSVNSVDSSSLNDQPRVQFALDFSQWSQEFQIYISQCKNLNRVEYKIEYSPLLTCTLELSVWHSSILGRNVCLGDVQVDMSSWDWQDKRLNWYPLNPRGSWGCKSAVQSIAVYPAHAPPVTDLQCNPSQCIQLMLL
ncbi:UNVERIFIED_CONTAM: hypothetical protein FKN15_055707 [Acipenser sinensis]